MNNRGVSNEVLGVLLLGVFIILILFITFSGGIVNQITATAAALIPSVALLLILLLYFTVFMGGEYTDRGGPR